MSSSSAGDPVERNNCALCLVALPPKIDSKVCKKCYEKHNTHNKYGAYPYPKESDASGVKDAAVKPIADSLPEHYCNLCHKPFSTATELEEHLIEHSFRGCEERGYNCYICSAIFTLPCGLHQHMIEHGPTYRPYDCNLCAKKFYFRAELENHLIDHETGRTGTPNEADAHSSTSNGFKSVLLKHDQENEHLKDSNDDSGSEKDHEMEFKSEAHPYSEDANAEEDDEYIEVEQIGESASINEAHRENEAHSPENEDDQHEKDNRNGEL